MYVLHLTRSRVFADVQQILDIFEQAGDEEEVSYGDGVSSP